MAIESTAVMPILQAEMASGHASASGGSASVTAIAHQALQKKWIENIFIDHARPTFTDLKRQIKSEYSSDEIEKLLALGAVEERDQTAILMDLAKCYSDGNLEELIVLIDTHRLTHELIDSIHPLDESGKFHSEHVAFIEAQIIAFHEKQGSKEPLTRAKIDETLEELAKAFPFPKRGIFHAILQKAQAFKADIIAHAILIRPTALEVEEAAGVGSFHEVTVRMNEDLPAIIAHIETHQLRYERLAKNIVAITKHASASEIERFLNSYDRKELFLAAFSGFKSGIVNFETLCRLSELLAVEDKTIKVLDPLKEDGKLNDHVIGILKHGLKRFLSEDEMAVFFERLITMPKEARLVFLFDTEGTFSLSKTVSPMNDILVNKQGFNLLNMVRFSTGNKRLLVSNQLIQMAFELQFPESFVKINPVFGISTAAQIRNNGLTNTRDLCMHYVAKDADGTLSVKKFIEADGFECIENDFETHDRYHAWVCSAMPNSMKSLSIEIADFFNRIAVDNRAKIGEANYLALRKLSWQFKDMDFLSFAIPKMAITDPSFPKYQAAKEEQERFHPSHCALIQALSNVFHVVIHDSIIVDEIKSLAMVPEASLSASGKSFLVKAKKAIKAGASFEKPDVPVELFLLIAEEFSNKIPEPLQFEISLKAVMSQTIMQLTVPIFLESKKLVETKLATMSMHERQILSRKLAFTEKLIEIATHL